jgi:hypothetical protein
MKKPGKGSRKRILLYSRTKMQIQWIQRLKLFTIIIKTLNKFYRGGNYDGSA